MVIDNSNLELRENRALDYFQNIVETVREPLVIEIEELPVIDADPIQMRQLLQNLIGNSLKYYRAGVPPVVRIQQKKVEVL
jgi:signal transduction histidine kinase